MAEDGDVHKDEVSLVIHVWLENQDRPAWRGRVTQSDGSHSGAFEDEETLIEFIRSRLRDISTVILPRMRLPS